MVEIEQFKQWLKDETDYSEAVIGDIGSRMKRADRMLEWNGEETYLFYLSKTKSYQELTVSVKSQVKKSVKLYIAYVERQGKMKRYRRSEKGEA